MTRPPPQTILVIGGGLGGLAFAQMLRHSSVADKYKVVIYERDTTAMERGQGYQIGINRSGLALLSSIPHVAFILDVQQKPNTASIVDGELNLMLQLKQGPGPDGKVGLVNRWKLRDALTDGLDIEWGKRFVRYEETDTGVTAHFEDGTHATGDLLVGADGSKSRVRLQRCPNLQLEEIPVLMTAGSVAITPAIRALLPTAVRLAEDASIVRAVAPGGNSVLVMNCDAPDGQTRLMWAYSFPAASAPDLPHEPAALKVAIDARAGVLGTELATLVRETAAADYVFGAPRALVSVVPTKENPLSATSRVTLLGDSAHVMTTHRGIGANTAFADAADLVRALSHGDDPWTGLAEYEALMIKRGFEAVRMSKQSTEMLHLAGAKSALRNVVVRALGWVLWGKQRIWG